MVAIGGALLLAFVAGSIVFDLTRRGKTTAVREPGTPPARDAGFGPGGPARANASAGTPPAGSAWTEPKTGARFRWIPGVTFTMGCVEGDTGCDPDEKPAHRVTLSRGYWLAETETTVGQFRKFVDATAFAVQPPVVGTMTLPIITPS